MLMFSMSVSVDGFVTDREGGIDWGGPSDELFLAHNDEVRSLGAYICGRRLYEAMLPWETDPSMRGTEPYAAFADIWRALPKIVFSRTLDRVEGNARLAERSLAQEVEAVLAGTTKDVSIGGAALAGAAIELGLVDELRMYRYPVVLGGGTPYLPAVADAIDLDLVESRTFDIGVVLERYRRAPDRRRT